jgi:hypothetical protein
MACAAIEPSGPERIKDYAPGGRIENSSQRHGPVVVAMIPVRVVQVAVDEIVDVIAVLHCFVAAVRAVNVLDVMAGAAMVRRAGSGIAFTYLEDVLVTVCFMRVMKAPVMQIINVFAVDHGSVAAIGSMDMRVVS